MQNKNKIVLFDLGNVLIKEVHPKLFDLIYSKINSFEISREEFDEKIYTIISDSFYGRISLEETWQRIKHFSKIDLDNFSSIIESVRINDYNKALVKEIKSIKKVAEVGIVSDLSQIGYSVVKDNLKNLLDLCDSKNIFISIFYGLTKVQDGDKFFDLIVDSVEFNPDDIVFVDDNIKLVELARARGINGILFIHDRNSSLWSESNRLLMAELKKYGIFI